MGILSHLLIHTCTLRIWSSGGTDAHGQDIDSWSTETSVPCLYMPRSHRQEPGQESFGTRKNILITEDSLFLDYRTDLNERCEISAIADGNGTSLNAGPVGIRLVKNAAGQSHHLEVMLQDAA